MQACRVLYLLQASCVPVISGRVSEAIGAWGSAKKAGDGLWHQRISCMRTRSFIGATRMIHSVIQLEVCRLWAHVPAPLVGDES